jgi:hypothetical protein
MTYLVSGDPARKRIDYYPEWLDNLADDVTLEGSVLNGEDYSSRVHGEPIGSVVTITRNAAGQTQHIVVNHRPLNSLLLFSRLMGEKFAGTTYGGQYARAGQ